MPTEPTPDPRFPVPDRSGLPQVTSDQISKEITIKRGQFVLNDGRPAIVEFWKDCDIALYCYTVFFSTLDAEDWDAQRHLKYLKENNLLQQSKLCDPNTHPEGGLGIKKIPDEAGQEVWSVTQALWQDDDVF